MIGQK